MTLPGHDDGLGPLLQPGAGPRRAGDRRLRHLLAGHRPVRDAHRAAAVLRRRRRGRRDGAPHDDPAAPVRAPAVGAARARRDRHPRDGARPGRALRLRRGDGERARGLPRRRASRAAAVAGAAVAGAAVAAAPRRQATPDADPVPAERLCAAARRAGHRVDPGHPAATAGRAGDDGPGEDEDDGTSLWAWIAGIAGILVLLARSASCCSGFLTGGGSPSPSPSGTPVDGAELRRPRHRRAPSAGARPSA